jgi:two-component system, LytTR family, sensor kinase
MASNNPYIKDRFRTSPNGWLIVIAIATALSLVYGVRSALGLITFGRQIDWIWDVGLEFNYWYVWAAYTPLVLWVARRFQPDEMSKPRWIAILLVFGLAIGLAQSATDWSLAITIEFLRHSPDFGRRVQQAKRGIPFGLFTNLIVYSLIVAGYYGYDYYRGFHERQLHSVELETLLARADLQNLKAQLQPHFLFNTLNTISVLMRRDPVAANQTLVQLSDLLRMSLNNVSAQETSLREELEFLDGYLKIEQTRFHDRLRVRRSIQTETLSAAVPNLILQPLVENAIKHGIAEKPGPGTIEICASRNDSRLQLEIKDDGPGIAGQIVDGVGLATTRRRLHHLYGAQHQFDLWERTSGGVIAKLIIPFRTYEPN